MVWAYKDPHAKLARGIFLCSFGRQVETELLSKPVGHSLWTWIFYVRHEPIFVCSGRPVGMLLPSSRMKSLLLSLYSVWPEVELLVSCALPRPHLGGPYNLMSTSLLRTLTNKQRTRNPDPTCPFISPTPLYISYEAILRASTRTP